MFLMKNLMLNIKLEALEPLKSLSVVRTSGVAVGGVGDL